MTCLNAGKILVQLSGEARAIRARDMFARGCELGSADACHLLVPMLIEGRGGAQLLDVAAEVAQILCEAGSDRVAAGKGMSFRGRPHRISKSTTRI